MALPGPDDVLQFWFGPDGPTVARPQWFRKDPAFDESIRQRFGPLVEAALHDEGLAQPHWQASAQTRLAQVLVLDQFPRNLFRGSPRSFAGDRRALALATRLVDDGEDALLAPLQRWFAYLPFEHAEDAAAQARSVALFEALAEDHPGMADALDYARRHRDVIERFGRFPHRNEVLGRPSSAEEIEFLRLPGSRF